MAEWVAVAAVAVAVVVALAVTVGVTAAAATGVGIAAGAVTQEINLAVTMAAAVCGGATLWAAVERLIGARW